MKRTIACLAVVIGALIFCAMPSHAQNWRKVLQLNGTLGSSAFFFNGQQGCIGTGHYQGGSAAQIYYTTDAGVTWRLSRMVNPNIAGQVTDIYFRDRLHGWATICEFAEKGWSGVYRTTDGGVSWDRALQAGFPAGVRETKRGVFYTDRNINNGVSFSSNNGKTWTQVGVSATALGIDFIDDLNGFVVSQAISVIEPHLMTTDGGLHWQTINATPECWSVYGDPVTRSFFLASEHDRLISSSGSAIFKVPIVNGVETRIKSYGDPGLTGGIAGAHVCQSVIYAQARPESPNPTAFIRTTDGGNSWQTVGGPNNLFDKRFAVTGRGAVVVAFDDSGGVWMTTNGGDGLLSPSVLKGVNIPNPILSLQATACDSASASVLLEYRLCDSVQISKVTFPDDSSGELSTDPPMPSPFFSTSRQLHFGIRYQPKNIENRTARAVLTIRQPDGYTEDTTITLQLKAGPAKISALEFSEITGKDTLNFDSVSTCVGASHRITLNNMGCTDLSIDSIYTSGSLFHFASGFQPFTLSSGTWRSFLIGYSPDSTRRDRAVLYVRHAGTLDSVVLFGVGYSSGEALSLSSSSPVAPECDSIQFSVALQNIACKTFKIDSIAARGAVHSIASLLPDSLHPSDRYSVPLEFVPSGVGSDTGSVTLSVTYEGGVHYDTVLRVIGSGTIGKPRFTTSRDSVFLGNISFCSTASDTLTLRSFGCTDVTVAALFDTTSGFSLAKQPKTTLLRRDSDVVTIRYQPHHAPGLFTEDLVFTTNAGIRTVPITVNVTADPGSIALSTTPKLSAYVCQGAPYVLSIANTLCDSLQVQAVRVSGNDSLDFVLFDTLPLTLKSGDEHSFEGSFIPQDSLQRTAQFILTLRKADGTSFDTTIAFAATGIGVPPIRVALSPASLHAPVLQNVSIPVIAAHGSTLPLSTLDATLLFNTDLLSPVGINNNGFFGSAATKIFTLHRCPSNHAFDTLDVHLAFTSNAILPSGELFELDCMPYVTSTLSTNILLAHAAFADVNNSTQCLSSERIDTIATFELDRACGDTTLAYFLGFQQIAFKSITPNPTSGHVVVTLKILNGYSGDANLEVYDLVGRKIDDVPITTANSSQNEVTLELDLGKNERGEGLRYLRLQTPHGSETRNVLLVK